jgi:hypothetical protein
MESNSERKAVFLLQGDGKCQMVESGLAPQGIC